MVLEVGFQVGEEEEEGVLRVRVDVADGCVGEGVDTVAGKLDPLLLPGVDDRAVREGSVLQDVRAQPVLVAPLLFGTHRVAVG